MRNPLSALIGCADEIITSLSEIRVAARHGGVPNGHSKHDSEISKNLHLLDEAIEATDTIIYCAMHQKRIIDDILILSRLDSNLLLVSPEPSQPIHLVRSALKMFESELKRAETKLEVIEEETLEILQVQWTLLDPSRVLQVLINLMSKAYPCTISFRRGLRREESSKTLSSSTCFLAFKVLTCSSKRNKVHPNRATSTHQDHNGRLPRQTLHDKLFWCPICRQEQHFSRPNHETRMGWRRGNIPLHNSK
jgi:hypothetical protein